MPPVSAQQCHLSVPSNATCQCPSVPPISVSQHHLSVPVSAANQSHLSAYQCHLSVLVSAAPISVHQCPSVPPISCRLSAPVSATYQCRLT
ncbi:unnamed protein product, partial [Staurois parvus]